MTVDTTTIAGIEGDGKWVAGALAPDGRVVGIPYFSDAVLLVNPDDNSTDTTTFPQVGASSESKYFGAATAANGRIYSIPLNADSVLTIDVGC